jgi:hypothetical protein
MKIYYVLEGCIDHFKNILLLLKVPQKPISGGVRPNGLKFSG